jgi:competence protein CoiA-like protein
MKKFTKAWDIQGNKPIDIRQLPLSRNGKKCNCTCVKCNDPLEACQGDKRSWYFRHISNKNCSGEPMTALHLMAQYLLTGDKSIQTGAGAIMYTGGVTEFPIPNSKRKADVAGKKLDGSNLILEILVTHKVEEEKRKLFQDQKIHSIEIDLSKVDPDIENDPLLNLLLEDISIQNPIYVPKVAGNGRWLVTGLIAFGLGSIIYKFFKKN